MHGACTLGYDEYITFPAPFLLKLKWIVLPFLVSSLLVVHTFSPFLSLLGARCILLMTLVDMYVKPAILLDDVGAVLVGCR